MARDEAAELRLTFAEHFRRARHALGLTQRAVAKGAEQRGIKPVIMIDTDPQGSPSVWWNRRQAETPLLSPLPHLRDLPSRLDEGNRYGDCVN